MTHHNLQLTKSQLTSSKNYRQWKKIQLTLKYWLRNRLSRQHRPMPQGGGHNVVVSLTSFPKRLAAVYFTIESLFDQSIPADHIVLWLSKDEFPHQQIPASLRRLQRRGLDVCWVDGNLKPYKKLIYALEAFKDFLIVTADDDTFYPPYWLKGLIHTHQCYSNAVICYRAKSVSFNDAGALLPYRQWKDLAVKDRPDLAVFPQGVGGVLYPPNCLDSRVTDQALFLKYAPTADDIWFKVMSVIKKTPCIRVFPVSLEFPKVIGSQAVSLHKINNQQGANDLQLSQTFAALGLCKNSFAMDDMGS